MSSNGPWLAVAIGEVLWDVFPDGARFGGAPANFVGSLKGLGGDGVRAVMVSGVGEDDLGRQALAALKDRNVETQFMDVVPQQTGKVDLRIDESGNATYEFAADTAWDCLAWSEKREQLAGQADVVCFGTLGQRDDKSRETVRRFVQSVPDAGWRVFDINLRKPFFNDNVILESLELANALKLNEDELPVVAELVSVNGDATEQLRQIADRFDLRVVALTRGADGSVLLKGEEMSELPGAEVDVVDTVGAGDAFTAAMVLGLLNELPLQQIHQHASQVSAFVCSQKGATPDFPEELKVG